MDNKNEEKRVNVRLDIDVDIMCQVHEWGVAEKYMKKSRIKNISAGGILIETMEKYEVGETLKTKIHIPNWGNYVTKFSGEEHKPTMLKVLAKVVWIKEGANEKYLVGASFVSMRDAACHALEKYVKDKIAGW